MEYEELKSIWKKYDEKLDNLEKLNKKLIMETLLAKPKKKIKRLKFQKVYRLIAIPVILLIALLPNLNFENLDSKFYIGCMLTIGVIVYYSYLKFKGYYILKDINLETDPILDSAKKIYRYKLLFNSHWKHAIFYYPIITFGVLLILWNHFTFNKWDILFLLIIFIVTYTLNIVSPMIYHERIKRLEKEITDLKEYID